MMMVQENGQKKLIEGRAGHTEVVGELNPAVLHRQQ